MTRCPCKLRCAHALIVPLSICKDLLCAWKPTSPGPARLSRPPHSCLESKEAGQVCSLAGWRTLGWRTLRVEDVGLMWHYLRGRRWWAGACGLGQLKVGCGQASCAQPSRFLGSPGPQGPWLWGHWGLPGTISHLFRCHSLAREAWCPQTQVAPFFPS